MSDRRHHENHDALEATATTVLKRAAPAWYWARKNFSFASLLTILSIIVSAGAYIISLKTRVVVIEHEIHDIQAVVPDTTALATLKADVAGHEARISRLEKNWDDAANTAAATAPYPARATRGKPGSP